MKNKPFYTTRLFYRSTVILAVIVLVLAFRAVTMSIIQDTAVLLTTSDTPTSKWTIDATQYNIIKTKLTLPDVAPRETKVVGTVTQTQDTPVASSTAAETSPETQTQSETVLNIKTLSIAIKNGTVIEGLAGVLKKSLDDAGFSNVSAANTRNPQKAHALYVKSDISDEQLTKLKESLPSSFTSINREDAIDGSKYDVEVIIGAPIE